MEDSTRTGMHESNLASRKAEEAALRRYQATAWLENLVGPLGILLQPSEREFISCLKNGLILCKAMNKIQPGSVLKVVDNSSNVQSSAWESQPLPAYQYFENVRNFLVAVEELKLPAFEASDIERDNLEAGSVGKVVDCVLTLKSYHEWKQMGGENGSNKYPRSPMLLHSAGRVHSRTPSNPALPDASRCLDLSPACESQLPVVDLIVNAMAEQMLNTKENMDENLFSSIHNGDLDPVKLFSKIMISCQEEKVQSKQPELKSVLKDHVGELNNKSLANSIEKSKCCRICSKTGNCGHWRLLKMQKKELSDLKVLLSNTKLEFEDLESQFQIDLKQLGSQVQEMSTAALGYQNVVKENRILYNMVQDLKGNIRVYCRIRPAVSAEAKNVIHSIRDDGTLVIVDPSKPQKDGRKVFQFNRVFGPNATQVDVFKDTQPLIRSVVDGYNVCIFAYGQTGSGKTHTMYGPSGGSEKDMGINYQALNDLFEISNKRKDTIAYDIHVQMVEIYNEQVRDLLTENSSITKLEIRSCTNDNGLSLPDAAMRPVKSSFDVLNLMNLGEVNRVVSSTAINARSSRSHSILTVHVHGKDTSGNIIRSCLHLVDLAGSERVDKSEVTGDRLKEAQYINKSLSCLGDVISALAQKNSHIPYRNSKLTLLLQDSLGGHAKTLMFAHVSPEGDSLGETLSTLKFAQRVSTVELGAASMNKENGEVMELKEQIDNLKKALASKEACNINSKNIDSKSSCTNIRTPMERTPPRSRRLSIENSRTVHPKNVVTDKTPPRTRRLSIENLSTTNSRTTMERTPPRQRRLSIEIRSSIKPTPMTAKTPPRSRRLSIENQSCLKLKEGMTEKSPARSRRLSIENRSSVKPKEVMTEKTSPRSRTLSIENRSGVKAKVVTTEKTPPRSRRLSIENRSSVKPKQVITEKTPPRSRRLSIENQSNVKPKAVMTEKTPPRSRRLSIENGITMKSFKATNLELQTPSAITRARRLSLEGSKHGKRDLMNIKSENSNTPLPLENMKLIKMESDAKITPIMMRGTSTSVGTEVQTVMKNKFSVSTEPQTRGNGKGAHIKRSLRTIGKLLKGSDKKNQQKLISRLPISNIDEGKSPLMTNATVLQQQSLTGVPPLLSRRSSIGGTTIHSKINGLRNSITPPPVQPSTMADKRWI